MIFVHLLEDPIKSQQRLTRLPLENFVAYFKPAADVILTLQFFIILFCSWCQEENASLTTDVIAYQIFKLFVKIKSNTLSLFFSSISPTPNFGFASKSCLFSSLIHWMSHLQYWQVKAFPKVILFELKVAVSYLWSSVNRNGNSILSDNKTNWNSSTNDNRNTNTKANI